MNLNPLKPRRVLTLLLSLLTASIIAQNYTWLKGSNSINSIGYYGTLGTPSATNNPGSRQGAAYWKDSNGDYWLFGGEGYDFYGNYGQLNDVWKYNIAQNTWTWITGDNAIAQVGVYGTKGVAAAGNKPGGRSFATAWVGPGGSVYLYGGYGYGSVAGIGYLGDLWKYAPSSNQWTWVSGYNSVYQAGVFGTMGVASASNVPGCRTNASGWYDNSGNLWLYGGLGHTTSSVSVGSLNDLWKFDLTAGTWTWMKGSNLINQNGSYGIQGTTAATSNPGGRQLAMTWTDASNSFYLFGGLGYDSTNTTDGPLSDLWKYDTGTGNWTWLKGSKLKSQPGTYGTIGTASVTNMPGARKAAFTWVDIAGNAWLGFGEGIGSATTSSGKLNDLWKYNFGTNVWTWVAGSGSADFPGIYGTMGTAAPSNIPGSRRYGSCWSDNSGNLWLFGGSGQAGTGTPGSLSDLWKFTNCHIAPISLSITTSNTLLCTGETVTLVASGANSLTWANGSTNPTLVITPVVTSSVYVVSTTNSNTCVYTATINQKADPCTSVSSVNAREGIQVFPNPAKGLLTIKTNGEAEILSIYIYDLPGREVLKETFKGDTKTLSFNLPGGLYTCRIVDSKQAVLKTQRLIVE